MTKDDWIKLAMPASITLLAISVFTVPLLSNAEGARMGDRWEPIYIKCMEGCN